MIKNIALFLLFVPFALSAQIGSKMSKVIGFIGSDQLIRTESKGGYIVQDFKTGTKEITSIYYNLDSVAVMVSFSRKDSLFILRDLITFEKANIPKYKANKKCMFGTTTYHLDTVHQILLLINYDTNPSDPHLIGFGATTDPILIKAWTQNLTGWIKE